MGECYSPLQTTTLLKGIMNWSGGKDSSLCLYKVLQSQAYKQLTLLTTVNAAFRRISMHGVRVELLEQQAASIGLPLQQIALPETVSMTEYSDTMRRVLLDFQQQGVTDSIFGDIFLEDLKHYREQQLAQVGIQGVFPLWKQEPKQLMQTFLDAGFRAVIVCVNDAYLDRSFAGRILDQDCINDLPANVDICGENGEYHSFVFDGPIFQYPIPFELGEVVHRTYQPVSNQPADNCYKDDCYQDKPPTWHNGFYYCDLLTK